MVLLVTGAMGHVGHAVVREAAKRGHTVIAQYRGTFREADAAAAGENVTWVRADLTDEAAVAAIAARHGVTDAIHAAAVPNDNVCRPDPLAAVKSNVDAVAILLDEARKRG